MARQIGTVTSSRLNLRRDPSMNHPPIVALPQGAEVEVLAREGQWYRVRFGGQEGFVSAGYLSIREAPAEAQRVGRVTATTLNVRSGPGTDAAVVGRLRQGDTVEILEERTGWLRVRGDGLEGFASAQFIDTGAPAPAPAPAGSPPVAAGAGFLLARPELLQIPLQPAVQIPITAGMASPARAAARTWNGFGGLLGAMSEALAVPAPASVSVLCVESGGAGFQGQRMIIRFENHQFFNHWGKDHPERFAQHFSYDPAKKWTKHQFRASAAEPWADFHGDQGREWRVFEFARALDEGAAMSSISMGAPQIMGFNYKRIGYRSVQEMFAAFAGDVRYHILGMFDFIRGDRAMVDALKERRYEDFAARYNGTGQAKEYGRLIQQHAEACAELLARAVPTIG